MSTSVHKPSSLTGRPASSYINQPKLLPREWYVAICNINCERRAQLGLNQKGFVTYLPVTTKTVNGGGCRKLERVISRPLFTRYLFVGTLERQMPFWHLGRTNGLESLVKVDGAPMTVPHSVLADIMQRERAGEFDEREPETLEDLGMSEGQMIEITAGPFVGIFGSIRRLMPRKNAEVLLSLFGSERSVKIRLAELKAAA